MSNRYEYRCLYKIPTKEPMHIVTDTEATGMFNSWDFETEEEALKFITDRTVIPFRKKEQ